jgi:glycosyltransferase involved in cell wall biosynthesis
MGVYSHWIEDLAQREVGSPRDGWLFRLLALTAKVGAARGQRRFDPRRGLVLADFEPSHEQLVRHFGQAPARLVLSIPPRTPLPETTYSLYQPGTNPLQWDAAVDAAIPEPLEDVATFLGWGEVAGKTLWVWRRAGVRRCWFMREDAGAGIPPLWAAIVKAIQAGWRALCGGRPEDMTVESCRRFLKELDAPPPIITGNLQRITHLIGSLGSGGAERQVCNTAVAQRQAGYDVRVIVQSPPLGRNAHYLPLLQEAGIPVDCCGEKWRDSFVAAWRGRRLNLGPLSVLPRGLRRFVLDLTGELLAQPTDVLHCWLDYTNVVGILAGHIAGVPRVVLSLRAVNPERCPRLLTPWMKPWYRIAAGMPGVGIVANSEAGARDYESWLRLPQGKIDVLRNSFVPPPDPSPADVARFREEHGLTPQTPVVACVFRLDVEKRPLFVLDLLAQVRARVPELRVLMAGCGLLEDAVRAEVNRRGFENVVHLLGQRKDVPVILAASQVMLLASEIEGTPNVSLEAQHFGCVPVLTDAGGSRETIIPDKTGILCDMNDGPGLVAAVESLLRDPARRAAMTRAGREFIAQRFDRRRIHEQTLAAYAALEPSTSVLPRAA